ncbi:MAG: IS1634 family transposase [bacterium]|nr:MAG: IS1634 family transposase [bacterium]
MYLKITKSGGYEYLRIVRSYWENGKAKQQAIANLGRLDILKQQGQLKQLGKKFLSLDGSDLPTIDELEETNRFCYGDIIYKTLWDKYRFPMMLSRLIKDKNIEYDFIQTVYLLVLDRLLNPGSKLASFQKQGKYIGVENVKLHHLYRCLDILSEAKNEIEQSIFERQKDLFHMSVDIVFYDVTTFHFESNRADDFKEFGFSKAGKFNEVQVVMGLLIDMDGNPIGYDLFPGDTFDGKTLLATLSALKQRFSIRKLIFVADKGINSKQNLHLIKEAGYDYIVSARIKNSSNKVKAAIFSSQDYQCLPSTEGDELNFKYKVIKDHKFTYRDDHGQSYQLLDNLIITWSAKRAHKDSLDRDRQIRKAQKAIDLKNKLNSKKGYQKYIATEGENIVVGLDEERIAQDALWDGYYEMQTSERNLAATVVIEAYQQLWKIEESFRVLKSTMRTRPIFHWTPKRIKGHFIVCFIAFVLERALESKLKSNKIEASSEKIKEAISSMEVSEIKLKGERYYLKSKHLTLASKILKILRIQHLKSVSSKDDMSSYMK